MKTDIDQYKRAVEAQIALKAAAHRVDVRSSSVEAEVARLVKAGHDNGVHPRAMAGFLIICEKDPSRGDAAIAALSVAGGGGKGRRP